MEKMEEEKMRAIKKNLMGTLEEDFEDNLDDIDESDLDQFLMNKEEPAKNDDKEVEKEDNEKGIFEDAKDDGSKEEKESDILDTENKGDKTKEKAEEELEEGDQPVRWICKGRSVTSPQVLFLAIFHSSSLSF